MQRYGNQIGALESILRTRGQFLIRYLSPEVYNVALQISRNLFQYFAADTEIVQSEGGASLKSHKGNLISVFIGLQWSSSTVKSHSIKLQQDGLGITVRDLTGYLRSYQFEPGLGAIFLSPLSGQRLELVIWGYDETGLCSAARLVPMLTGVGQPDFVIVRKVSAWKGAAGVLAMGLFDHDWNVSQASFLS